MIHFKLPITLTLRFLSEFVKSCHGSLCLQVRRRQGCSAGSLLKSTDQSDFPICLANEIMAYAGNMNGFDEAPLMQSSGSHGAARGFASIRVCLPLPAGVVFFQRVSPSLVKQCPCMCNPTNESVWHIHRISSVNPLKHSCMWFILPVGIRKSAHRGTLILRVFPFLLSCTYSLCHPPDI